jgi:hypothetical protein
MHLSISVNIFPLRVHAVTSSRTSILLVTAAEMREVPYSFISFQDKQPPAISDQKKKLSAISAQLSARPILLLSHFTTSLFFYYFQLSAADSRLCFQPNELYELYRLHECSVR